MRSRARSRCMSEGLAARLLTYQGLARGEGIAFASGMSIARERTLDECGKRQGSPCKQHIIDATSHRQT